MVPQFRCHQLLEKVAPRHRALHVCLFFPFGQDALIAVHWLQAGEGSPGHVETQEGGRHVPGQPPADLNRTLPPTFPSWATSGMTDWNENIHKPDFEGSWEAATERISIRET